MHEINAERKCQKEMKCFHCHSGEHNGAYKDCPEYLRNQLIKESMYYNNQTFMEANDEFPRTESQYRLAEKQKEFPKLVASQRKQNVEAEQKSFPRKTPQELKKQYGDYVLLNQGKKPTVFDTTAMPFSAVVGQPQPKAPEVTTPVRLERNVMTNEKSTDGDNEKMARGYIHAVKLLQEIDQRMQMDFEDPDSPGSSLKNDVLLMEIGRLVMGYNLKYGRRVVPYSSEEEETTN